MNLMDFMMLSMLFECTVKSGPSSVTKYASQKTSGQHFGGNQGGSSNGAVPMELGHLKSQDRF